MIDVEGCYLARLREVAILAEIVGSLADQPLKRAGDVLSIH